MICPHCEYINKCNCSNCNPDKLTDGYYTISENRENAICFNCKIEFSPDASSDLEWKKTEESASLVITEKICYDWINILIKINELRSEGRYEDAKMLKNYEGDFIKKTNYDEFWFNRLFQKYFHTTIVDVLKDNGVSFRRDLKINNIFDEN